MSSLVSRFQACGVIQRSAELAGHPLGVAFKGAVGDIAGRVHNSRAGALIKPPVRDRLCRSIANQPGNKTKEFR